MEKTNTPITIGIQGNGKTSLLNSINSLTQKDEFSNLDKCMGELSSFYAGSLAQNH